MQDAGLDESQAGIKTAGRNINNLMYADNTTLMAPRKPIQEVFKGRRKRKPFPTPVVIQQGKRQNILPVLY